MQRNILLFFIVTIGILFMGCSNPAEDTFKSNTKAITMFSFASPAMTGTIEESSHTISVIVPYGTDITALTPVISHTGAVINPGSGVVQNFTNPVVYTVTAADGSAQNYTVQVGWTPVVSAPQIETSTIAGTSARGTYGVSSAGNVSVSDSGICWNTIGNPTVCSSIASGSSGTLTGLSPDTTYYVRSYAINSFGTGYSAEISFNSGKTFGTLHEGGYVFYNDGNSHGLIAATIDQSSGIQWDNGTYSGISAASGTAIGTGQANTTAIVLAQGTSVNYAARLCDELDSGGKTDWYLPSIGELSLIYNNLKSYNIGGLTNDTYWSSTVYVGYFIWYENFSDGSQNPQFPNTWNSGELKAVRAIRNF